MNKKKNKPQKKQPRLGRKALIAGIHSYFVENPFSSFNYKQVASVMGARDVAAKTWLEKY